MTTYIDQLASLSKQIPDSIAEEDLSRLEQTATEFQHILMRVHNHDAVYRTNTQYYYAYIKNIESALYHAKYGHDQKQRDASFKKARKQLTSAIDALTGLIHDTTQSDDPTS